MLTLFLAPTAREARRAAWSFLGEKAAIPGAGTPNLAALLDPPLIFSEANAAPFWRDLARENATRTAMAPRLVRAEAFFARSHAALARQRALAGADRLWVLQGAARRAAAGASNAELEHDLAHIATHSEALRVAAQHIAALRRAHLSHFPAAPGAEVLNALLRVYEARLESLEAFDFEAAPALFPFSAARSRAFAFPNALIVDDLTGISPALRIGLEALLERASLVAATLVCAEIDNSAALEGALEFWRARGADIRRVGDFETGAARVAARILGSEKAAPAPANLFLTPAHTPREEMERIAAQIRLEVEAGARPDDFGIGLADFGAYEADTRQVFAEYGVPLDWSFAPPLRNSPLIRALLGALDSGWNPDIHRLHDLFGDGTLRFESREKRLDARRLRAAGMAARHPALDDPAAAKAAFERRCAQLKREARHDDAPGRARIEAALLAGDLELVAEFGKLRAPLEQDCPARVWQVSVLAVADRLAAHWLDIESPAGARAQNDLARFKIAIENLANRARGWDGDAERARSASEWKNWLEMEIESGAGDERLARNGGVFVGGIDPSNGVSIGGARATFWCGLSERVWPRAALQNAATRELEQILRAHQAAPLALATHALARGAGENRALYLSHARYLQGDETPASPLLDDLRAAFPGHIWPELVLAPPQDATRREVLRAWNLWSEAGRFDAAEAAGDEPKQLQTLAKMRAERREIAAIGVYDGVLGARGRELMAERDQSRGAHLSGSDLEFYARCPLRYFFERVLRLRHPERLDDDIDARAAGTLVHEIVRLALPATAPAIAGADFEAGIAVVGEIARAACEKLPIRPILREAEWRRLMGCDGRRGPLAQWLRLEIALGNGAWGVEMRPLTHSGVRIDGLSSGLEHRFEIEIGGHTFKGFIDRIDSSADGGHLAIIDYKTGDIAGLPNWKAGDNGLHFQLAIYALAVRKLGLEALGVEGAPPRLAMAYLSLKRAKIARGIGQEGTLGRGCSGAKMLGDAAFEAWLDDVSARAARIGDLRGAGVFNLALQNPKDAKCSSCASKSLCGQHAVTQAARLDAHRDSPFVYLPAFREWEA